MICACAGKYTYSDINFAQVRLLDNGVEKHHAHTCRHTPPPPPPPPHGPGIPHDYEREYAERAERGMGFQQVHDTEFQSSSPLMEEVDFSTFLRMISTLKPCLQRWSAFHCKLFYTIKLSLAYCNTFSINKTCPSLPRPRVFFTQ
jgi:hypothetical protein